MAYVTPEKECEMQTVEEISQVSAFSLYMGARYDDHAVIAVPEGRYVE